MKFFSSKIIPLLRAFFILCNIRLAYAVNNHISMPYGDDYMILIGEGKDNAGNATVVQELYYNDVYNVNVDRVHVAFCNVQWVPGVSNKHAISIAYSAEYTGPRLTLISSELRSFPHGNAHIIQARLADSLSNKNGFDGTCSYEAHINPAMQSVENNNQKENEYEVVDVACEARKKYVHGHYPLPTSFY